MKHNTFVYRIHYNTSSFSMTSSIFKGSLVIIFVYLIIIPYIHQLIRLILYPRQCLNDFPFLLRFHLCYWLFFFFSFLGREHFHYRLLSRITLSKSLTTTVRYFAWPYAILLSTHRYILLYTILKILRFTKA